MTLHRILHQSHQLHFKSLPAKVTALQEQMARIGNAVSQRLTLLRTHLAAQHAYATRCSVLDMMLEAYSILETMESLCSKAGASLSSGAAASGTGLQGQADADVDASAPDAERMILLSRLTGLYQRYRHLVLHLSSVSASSAPATSGAAAGTQAPPPAVTTGQSTAPLPLFAALSPRAEAVKRWTLQQLDGMFLSILSQALRESPVAADMRDAVATAPSFLEGLLQGYHALGCQQYAERLLLLGRPDASSSAQGSLLARLLNNATSSATATPSGVVDVPRALNTLLEEVVRIGKAVLFHPVYQLLRVSCAVNPDPASGFNWVARGLFLPVVSQLLAVTSSSAAPSSSSSSVATAATASPTAGWQAFASLFSARDPDQFHQNFLTVTRWIDALESMCPDSAHVLSLRQHESFAALHKRWNMDFFFLSRYGGNRYYSLVEYDVSRRVDMGFAHRGHSSCLAQATFDCGPCGRSNGYEGGSSLKPRRGHLQHFPAAVAATNTVHHRHTISMLGCVVAHLAPAVGTPTARPLDTMCASPRALDELYDIHHHYYCNSNTSVNDGRSNGGSCINDNPNDSHDAVVNPRLHGRCIAGLSTDACS
jgi:hypothetical protein